MAGYTMPRKRWEAFIKYSCFLLEIFRFSTVLQHLCSSGDWAISPVFQHFVANRKSPTQNSARPYSLPPYVHSSAVPNSNRLLSKTSSAKSVTPHERSTSSYGLRPKNATILSGDRRLPRVNRTLENRPKLVWSVLVTHEQAHLRKTTRHANTSVKSRRPVW